jgi:P-type Ca2+ transporter type 2C
VFSLDVLRDHRFLMFSGASVIAIVLGPQLNLFNRTLHTLPLTLRQWLICIVAALAVVVVTEIRKFVLRRREAAAPEAPAVGTPELASP